MHRLLLTQTNFLFFLIFANISFGQLENKLLPFIHNIPFSNFSSETINQIDKDDSGVFYMATHSGLIETDGINYNKYDSGKLTDLEGLYVQNDSLIYSCGYGGFGKWVRSKTGTFEYEPIYYKNPSLADYTQPVFLNVLPYKEKIVFHAHNQLYFFDPIENSFHIDQAPDFFGKIFIQSENPIDFIEIYSINGKQIDRLLFDKKTNISIEPKLSKGFYFLNFNNLTIKKLLIQ